MRTKRSPAIFVAVALVMGACTSSSVPLDEVPELPAASPDEIALLLASSEQPVLVNVWASWCGPCRSEAPLLRSAVAEWGDRVHFIGVDVRDNQGAARAFIADFGLDGMDHRFDPAGAIPAALGGSGVPLTFFFRPGGELAHLQHGVIDERTLALWLDEILGEP